MVTVRLDDYEACVLEDLLLGDIRQLGEWYGQSSFWKLPLKKSARLYAEIKFGSAAYDLLLLKQELRKKGEA